MSFFPSILDVTDETEVKLSDFLKLVWETHATDEATTVEEETVSSILESTGSEWVCVTFDVQLRAKEFEERAFDALLSIGNVTEFLFDGELPASSLPRLLIRGLSRAPHLLRPNSLYGMPNDG